MAQVTYRGVSYDSEEYRKVVQKAAQQRNFDLMYRGVKVAKKLVEYGISKLGDSHATYNSALLTSIDNCSTMEDINIIYEDYLGDELPRTQALALSKYDSDGYRTYNAGRITPSFL